MTSSPGGYAAVRPCPQLHDTDLPTRVPEFHFLDGSGSGECAVDPAESFRSVQPSIYLVLLEFRIAHGMFNQQNG